MERNIENFNNNKLEEVMQELVNSFNSLGISTNEACKAMNNLTKCIPPLDESDIVLIMSNPTMSIFRKILIIWRIKRYLRRKKKNEERV